MASSYTTNFGIEEMAAGDQTGSWGDTTNFNFDILDRIAAYKAVALSDAATATLTVREASPGSGTENLQDGMFRVIKFTGSLSQNCTITIAPNTTTAWFIFENATTDAGSSGPYSLLFSQGSGANVTLQNGKNAIVYCDGAGAGAVVTDALADLQVGTLEVTGAAAVDGAATLGSTLAVTSTSSLSAKVTHNYTSSARMPVGTTGQRDGSPGVGDFRYNSTTNEFEGYSGASPAWGGIGAGAGYFKGDNGTTGSSAGDIFRINELALDANVTISSTENASATGPLTVSSSYTLTVEGTLVII
tara:strand:- start:525 stop:1430 length:906 start_codon:yes stop_codon:yes gene_type:complete